MFSQPQCKEIQARRINSMRAVDCIRHGAYGISVNSNIIDASHVFEAAGTINKLWRIAVKELKGLYVIINTTAEDEYSPIELTRKAISGGADIIQFRDKGDGTEDFLFLAKGIKELCQEAGVTFIVNDRVDVAEAIGADGVHLGQGDFPISVARSVLGNEKIIGGTARNLEEARKVEELGADYIGFGHLFPDQIREGEGNFADLESIEELCTTTDLPVMAFGGVSEDNASAVLEAGVTGIAMVSAVSDTEDPEEGIQRLKVLIETFSRGGVYVADR